MTMSENGRGYASANSCSFWGAVLAVSSCTSPQELRHLSFRLSQINRPRTGRDVSENISKGQYQNIWARLRFRHHGPGERPTFHNGCKSPARVLFGPDPGVRVVFKHARARGMSIFEELEEVPLPRMFPVPNGTCLE